MIITEGLAPAATLIFLSSVSIWLHNHFLLQAPVLIFSKDASGMEL